MLKKKLISLLYNCPEIIETIDACNKYELKDYYIAGGVVTQLIWNSINKQPLLKNVKDFDIIYFSDDEGRKEFEIHQLEINKLVKHNFPLDIINQAYVHEWYPKKFGNEITAFKNTENGIQTWLSALAIGVRKKLNFEIYAPYDLEDAFNMNVKPNKLAMSEKNYITMTKSFKERWQNIKIEAW